MGVLVSDAVAAFFAARRPRKDSPHTTAAYRRDVAGVVGLLAEQVGRPVADLVVGDVTVSSLRGAFGVFADGHARSSVSRAWSTWNQVLTFWVAQGWLVGNPMGGVARPRVVAAVPKPLRGEDTPERLLSAVVVGGGRDPWPERDVLVVALGLVAGLRSAEMRGLTVGSLVGRRGEYRLHVVGKGLRDRSVPVESSLADVFSAYVESCRVRFGVRLGRSAPLLLDRRGEPIGRGGLEYLVKSCFRRAGVHDRVPSGASLHALRHTFATRLAEDGASASEIMALLGHASLASSQNYIDATGRERRAAAAANRTYRVLGEIAGG